METDNADNFEGQQPLENKEAAPVKDEGGPRCPPGSSLVLTLKQETDLVNYCIERLEEMEKNNREWNELRKNYLSEHENDFNHRARPGTIFEKSNSSFNQSRRNAMPIIARLQRDFLGTDPFFTVKPTRNEGSTQEPDKVQNFAIYKAKGAKLKTALMDAIEVAAVAGERVMKIVYDRDQTRWLVKANILVDDKDQPIFTPNTKDVIFDYDTYVDSSFFGNPIPVTNPDPPATPGAPPPLPAPVTIKSRLQSFAEWLKPPPPAPIQMTGHSVLKKDPAFPEPAEKKFKKMMVERIHTRYAGPVVSGINHGDFLAPLNEPDLQKSPYCAHKFDMLNPLIVEKYVFGISGEDLDPQEKLFYNLLCEKIKDLEGETADPKSDEKLPNHQAGENFADTGDKYNTVSQLVEFCVYCDPTGIGKVSDVFLVLHPTKKFALFYDYRANVVHPKVGRPYRPVRVTPVRSRWYGLGEYALNMHKQKFIDWCLNQATYASATAGKYNIYDPEAIEGWDEAEPVPGPHWHKKKGGWAGDLEKAVVVIASPALPDDLKDMRDAMMQSAQAERGNLSPGGDSLSQLPSSKLKYGIQAIERSGDELYAVSAMNTEEGVTDVVEAFVVTMLANMDPVEEFKFTDGDQYLSSQINKSDIDDIDMNIDLEMSLTRGDQINEQNETAYNIVLAYLALPAFQQAAVNEFTIARLKAMDIDNAEKSVPMPPAQDVEQSLAAFRAQQEQMMQPPQPGMPPGPPGAGGAPPGAPPSPTPPATDPAQPPPAGPKVI